MFYEKRKVIYEHLGNYLRRYYAYRLHYPYHFINSSAAKAAEYEFGFIRLIIKLLRQDRRCYKRAGFEPAYQGRCYRTVCYDAYRKHHRHCCRQVSALRSVCL